VFVFPIAATTSLRSEVAKTNSSLENGFGFVRKGKLDFPSVLFAPTTIGSCEGTKRKRPAIFAAVP